MTDFRPRNFTSLEGLRGYMAWTVVLMHVVYFSGYAQQRPFVWLVPLLNGVGAVNVFIVVSGFVITHLLLVRDEPYRPYIVRRALRIVPIYYLCLVIALAVLPAQIELHTHQWVVDRASWAHNFDMLRTNMPAYVLLHITLLHGAVPDSVLPQSAWQILGPAWSLSLEWQFYLLAPPLLKLLRINRMAQVTTVFLLLACMLLWRRWFGAAWSQPAVLPLSIHFFLLGILCRLHLPALARLSPVVIPVVGLAAAVAFRSFRYEIMIWAVFLTAAVLEVRSAESGTSALTGIHRAFAWLTGNRFVTSLGRCSYSTYLIHIPFLAGLTWIASHLFGISTQQGNFAVMLVALPLLVLLSGMLYDYVEAPFIRLGARYAAVEPIVPTKVAGTT